MSGRWGGSDGLAIANSRLSEVPRHLGDWQSDQDFQIPERELKSSGITAYVSRLYVNQQSGQQVNLLLVCGVPGRIAVHTPDICLQGGGYEMLAEPKRDRIADNEFWSADFSGTGAASHAKTNVLWGWTTQGNWRASSNPRYEFAGQHYLYKMYVASAAKANQSQAVAAEDFLTLLLPTLRERLGSQ
jgi:hypothetical protein